MTKQPGKLSRADFKYLMSLLNKVQEAEKEIENDGDNKAEAVAIIVGLFVGLIGGPIASLVYYESSPEERFHVFIIPEIVGFIAGLMIYAGKLKKKKSNISS